MDALKKVSAAAGALKIFPLPPVVLFPGTSVPLHIFEPRYRQLVTDALAQDRVIAIGGLRPGWEAQYEGRPPLSSICCVGLIGPADQLPDGRFLIAVEGIARARIVEELAANQPYREVRAEILVDPPFAGEEEELLRHAVLELASLLPQDTSAPLLHHAALHRGGALADVVASAVIGSAPRRAELLAELDVGQRLRAVHSEITSLIANVAASRPKPYLN